MKVFIPIFICMFYLQSIFAHPMHFSVTNIDIYNDSISVAVRVFKDDLNKVLVQNGLIQSGDNFVIDNIKTAKAVEGYIFSHFYVRKENETVTLKFKEIRKKDNLSFWIYFSAMLNNKKGVFFIKSTVLFDLYSDQKNMVIVKSGDFEKGIIFTLPGKEEKIVVK